MERERGKGREGRGREGGREGRERGEGERERGEGRRYTLEYKLAHYPVYESQVAWHQFIKIISYKYSAYVDFNLI